MRKILVLAMVCACGEEGAQLGAGGRGTAELRTRPTMPPVTTLADHERLLPEGTHYFFSLISRAPGGRETTDSTGGIGWRAYGVDVSRRQVAFQIQLNSVEELRSFSDRLRTEEFRATMENPGAAVHYGDMGQIELPPPPPPPGPGGDEWIAGRLVHLGAADQNLQHEFNAPAAP